MTKTPARLEKRASQAITVDFFTEGDIMDAE